MGIHALRYLHELSTFTWCIFPLFHTLRSVRVCQGGSLDFAKVQKHQRESSLLDPPSHISVNSGLRLRKVPNADGDVKLSLYLIEKPLYLFLEDEKGHSVFKAYLRSCFAVENILFIEAVTIFRQLLLELARVPSPAMPTIDEVTPQRMSVLARTSALMDPELATKVQEQHQQQNRSIPRLELAFLDRLHAEFRTLIDSDGTLDWSTSTFEENKASVHAAALHICDKFIRDVSSTEAQVNIADETRGTIMARLRDAVNFESYDAYIELFDDAYSEIFRLAMTIFSFQFKLFCRLQ